MSNEPVPAETAGSGLVVLSVILLLAAAFLVIDGVWVMYSYDGIDRTGPVGGDAFNYQIWAIRGAGIIAAGAAAAVASATLAIMAVWARRP